MSKHNYRSTIILDTRGRDESVDALIEGLKKEVAAVQGHVVASSSEGNRNFVRVTDVKFPSGVYVSMQMEGPSTLPAALKERVRLNKAVYRWFIERAA